MAYRSPDTTLQDGLAASQAGFGITPPLPRRPGERAHIGFEEALVGQEERQERPQAQQQGGAAARGGLDLLSITDVCQGLGMGKSWVYRRIQSGEIPSVKLGRNIKVRREDLEGYLEAQRYR